MIQSAVRERPILFSGEMVRAILEGRKTQTRRVVKPQPRVDDQGHFIVGEKNYGRCLMTGKPWTKDFVQFHCPHGLPGERLWVRETHAIVPRTAYAASDGVQQTLRPDDNHDAAVYAEDWVRSRPGRWRPSIHMPRWACRIELEITNVRVERLQEITEEDAKAEGLRGITKDGNLVKYGIPDRDGLPGNDDYGWPWHLWRISPIDAYQVLWDQINAKRGYGWDGNPWVWVISFRRAG